MRPIYLRAKNFLGIRECEIDFNQIKGNVFAIVGKNGSGKSSILEAINFALYGESIRNTRETKRLPRRTSQPTSEATEVVFLFEHKGEYYRVIRKFISNWQTYLCKVNPSFELKPQKWKEKRPLCTKTQETNNYITKILGFGPKIFKSAILLPQGRLLDLINKTASEKKEIIKELTTLKEIDKVIEITKEERQKQKDKLIEVQSQRDTIMQQLQHYDKDKLLTNKKRFQNALECIQAFKDKIKSLIALTDKLIGIKDQVEEETKNLNEVKSQKQHTALKVYLPALMEKRDMTVQLNVIQKAFSCYKTAPQKEAVAKIKLKLSALLEKHKALKTEKEALSNRVDQFKNAISEKKLLFNSLNKKLKESLPQDLYPHLECITPKEDFLEFLSLYLENLKDVKEKLLKEQFIKNKITPILREIKSLTVQQKEIKLQLEETRRQISVSLNNKEHLEGLIKKVKAELDKAVNQEQRLEALYKSLNDFYKETSDIRVSLKQLKENEALLEGKLRDIERQKSEQKNIKQKLDKEILELERLFKIYEDELERDLNSYIIPLLREKAEETGFCPVCGNKWEKKEVKAKKIDLSFNEKDISDVYKKIKSISLKLNEKKQLYAEVSANLNNLLMNEKELKKQIKETKSLYAKLMKDYKNLAEEKDLLSFLEDLKQSKKSLKQALSEIENRLKTIKQQVNDLQSELKKKEISLKSEETKIEEKSLQLQKLEKQHKHLEQKILKLQQQVSDYLKEMPLKESANRLENFDHGSLLATLDGVITEITTVVSDIKNLKSSLAEVKTDLDKKLLTFKEVEKDTKSQIDYARKLLKEVVESINDILSKGIAKEFVVLPQSLKNALEGFVTSYEFMAVIDRVFSFIETSLEELLKQTQEKMAILERDIASFVSTLKHLYEKEVRLKQQIMLLESSYNQEYDNLTNAIKATGINRIFKGDLKEFYYVLENLSRRLDVVRENIIKKVARIDGLLHEYEAKQKFLIDLEKRFEEQVSIVSEYEAFEHYLKRFEGYAVERTLEAVLDRANQILSSSTNNRFLIKSSEQIREYEPVRKASTSYKKVEGEFYIVDNAREIDNNIASVKELSGGEQTLIALSMALAIVETTGADVGCMFIDEGLSMLDQSNLSTVVEIIKTIATDMEKIIGIITHNKDVAEQFPHTLVMENGIGSFY